jgi:hypothetical protein
MSRGLQKTGRPGDLKVVSNNPLPTPAPAVPKTRISKPRKHTTRQHWGLPAGFFFLATLLAGLFFQALQPELRLIYVIGIAAGLGAVILKTSGLSHSGSLGDRLNITPIQALLVMPVIFFLLIVYFGGANVLEWLVGDQPSQRFLILGLGIVCGVGIELCLDRTLRAIINRDKA